MSPEEIALYQTLITAISGFLGVFIGAVITIIFNWKIKTKEVKLRIIEKIFDKRISAHEEILKISKMLRITHLTYLVDDEKNALTYPAFMSNKESLDNLIFDIHTIVNTNSHWLDIEIFRELNYLQDYLANLDGFIKHIEESEFSSLGIKIKSDIIDLAGSLEKLVIRFFKKDIYQINLNISEGHHKYPKEVTLERLNNTKLLQVINNTA